MKVGQFPFINICLVCSLTISLKTGAAEQPSSLAPTNVANDKKVSLYLVSGTGSAVGAEKTKLQDLPLEQAPLFTSDEIVRYDIDSHAFLLTKEAYEKVAQLHVPTDGKAFVVSVGNRRVYSGAFWIVESSEPWYGITIMQPPGKRRQELKITAGSTGQKDLRNDPEILEIMKSRK
jgi:hypothetical protein